jgi:HlyD family secretion protein
VAQGEADLEIASINFKRMDGLFHQGVEPAQSFDQARTSLDSVKARVEALRRQAQAAQSAVALAKTGADQVAARRAALEASHHQLAAAAAQEDKARIRLGYTDIGAPIGGVVDVRAALQGEVVTPGQAIVTLIDPDDLWVRADVEESYIDLVHLKDRLTVRLPSGAQRQGVVFYRHLDADFATQRDVSRTKRDIKTFEIRLHCDNRDRSLAVGMTAYVTFPLGK